MGIQRERERGGEGGRERERERERRWGGGYSSTVADILEAREVQISTTALTGMFINI